MALLLGDKDGLIKFASLETMPVVKPLERTRLVHTSSFQCLISISHTGSAICGPSLTGRRVEFIAQCLNAAWLVDVPEGSFGSSDILEYERLWR